MPAIAAAEAAMPAIAAAEEAMPAAASMDLGNLPSGQLSLDLPMDFNAVPNVGNTVHVVQGATRGQLASINPCQHHASACKCATAPCQPLLFQQGFAHTTSVPNGQVDCLQLLSSMPNLC